MKTETKFKLPAENQHILDQAKAFMTNNMVTILFIVLSIVGFIAAGMTPFQFLFDIVARISRNSFLVLALIIPVVAGMGPNFSIVLGAMAAQAVVIFVAHWGMKGVPILGQTGLPGILLCMVLVIPLALILGYLTGKLFNKTKGQEMIAGLILAFFAQGVYEFIFLQLVGGYIPMENEILVLSQGVGIRTTIDLAPTVRAGVDWSGLRYALDWPGMRYGMDTLLRPTLPWTVLVVSLGSVATYLVAWFGFKRRFLGSLVKEIPALAVATVLIATSVMVMLDKSSLINMIRIPTLTWSLILLLCLFMAFFLKTKLGQDMRTVGQDRHVAAVAGIKVDRVRIIAIMMSMLMAAWGHIIFLQNMGAFSTYGSHEQVGLYAVAALLIGGATVAKATIGQALLGVFLFHTLFIISPTAGREIFGDAQIGEYFRVFVAYGVIAVSLVMHVWKTRIQARNKPGLS